MKGGFQQPGLSFAARIGGNPMPHAQPTAHAVEIGDAQVPRFAGSTCLENMNQ